MKPALPPTAAARSTHEAGHFVVGALVDIKATEATITDDYQRKTHASITHIVQSRALAPTDPASRALTRRLLLSTLGGIAADSEAGTYPDPTHWTGDLTRALRLAIALASDDPLATIAEYTRRSRRLIRRYRALVDEFALDLLDRGTIGGDELRPWENRIAFERRLRRMPRRPLFTPAAEAFEDNGARPLGPDFWKLADPAEKT